jgi:hypothetical protein
MSSLLLSIAGLLVVAYLIFGLTLLVMQPKLLYHPVREINSTPADLGLEYEEAVFSSADGIRLHGWYVPGSQPRFTVLFCHGNGGNVMHRLDSIDLFHDLGLSCLVFDYRGYGQSAGRPTEAGTYLDARAAFDWLTQSKGVLPERVIVLGRSLGGSIAAHLATEVRPAGLVVESAFTSYPDIGARFYPYMPVRLFARFRYDTLASVRKVSCPILLMHSRNDEVVPFDFGTRLFAAAGEPKQFVEIRGQHNDGFLVSGDLYRNAWRNWLQSIEERDARRTVPQPS